MATGLPHWSICPKAGLLKSPKRPFGKSSQLSALFSSPLPASPSVGAGTSSPFVAESVALCGVMMRSGS